MSIEDRLRTALHDEADGTHVDPASFDRIERRTAVARRRRRAMGGGLALVAVVAVAVGVPLALQGDGEPVRTGPASDTQGTVTTTSTTTGEAPTVPGDEVPAFTWPALQGDVLYDSLEQAAGAFGTGFLGMVSPVTEVVDSTHVVLRPRPEGGGAAPSDGPRTVVDVAEYPSGEPEAPHWFVTGAASPNIEVDSPTTRTDVGSPVMVSGRARNLFEANVIVELRNEAGDLVARTNTTAAGSGPELALFSVDVSFEATGRGAVIVSSDSGLEGTPEATVVPVTFAARAEGGTEVTVFLQDPQGDFVPVTREVPRTTGVLRAALEQQLLGAYPGEQARGLTSPFSEDGQLLRGVTITGDGTAVVDFEPSIVDALAGADGAAVLASLDRTAFHFPTVTWVRYSVGGQCQDIAGIGTDLLCERRSRDPY